MIGNLLKILTANTDYEKEMLKVLFRNVDGFYTDLNELSDDMNNDCFSYRSSFSQGYCKMVFREYFEEILQSIEDYRFRCCDRYPTNYEYDEMVILGFEILLTDWAEQLEYYLEGNN